MTTSTTPLVKVRKRSTPIVMIRKLFKNDTDIIRAASDGRLDKVAELIGLGMDVKPLLLACSGYGSCRYEPHYVVAGPGGAEQPLYNLTSSGWATEVEARTEV